MEDMTPRRLQKFRNDLMYRYRITVEKFLELLEEQGHSCPICDAELKPGMQSRNGPNKPVVDHCHDSQNVRGLLCHRCNLLIGHARENTDILHRAIVYLAQRSVL
jgi:hypothetical protein